MSAPTPFLFVVGGARSGKSDFAVEAGRRFDGPVTFLATATAGDDDMRRRIERHRQDRPTRWNVVEEPLQLAPALVGIGPDDAVIIDCLTMWVANAIFADWSDTETEAATSELTVALADRSALSVVVSNEVGLGIHPDNELGRRYQNLLGRVNRLVASGASQTLFFVAGRAVVLRDPWDVIERW